jgi:hypothetical protein
MKWLHESWTAERGKALSVLFEANTTRSRDAITAAWQSIPDEHRAWLGDTLKQNRLPLSCVAAFMVPVLSEEACKHIVEKGETCIWEEHEDEEPEYRMPEVVLAHADPVFDAQVKRALYAGLGPWLLGIWGRLPSRYTSVQLTRYSEADDRTQGGYHIDRDSDYTAVIALNDDFAGGGTTLVDGLLGEIHLPPVPVGWALVFDGKRTLHKGRHVTAGTRRLLTVWADNQDGIW